jgi:imidazoleglycerol phosphate synthase glutamine amidotransferase subunit HisH
MDSSAASLAASNGLVCIALAVLDAHMLFMPGVGANDSPMAESEANLRG